MAAIISVEGLGKRYAGGVSALEDVCLEIEKGEILALLGPNGAGKTTLISIICGLVTPSAGRVTVGGHDVVTDYREARRLIGLVPQEVALEPFEKVINSVRFSRGVFGRPGDPARIEAVLRQLSLWDKRDAQIMTLSGGMKRRVLIAKALAHDPDILFLDEPTAGVDVELRREMWQMVRELKAAGVTILLTTHYIEEAEAMADRVGVITGGRVLLVEEKNALMRRMGKREMRLELQEPVGELPAALAPYGLECEEDGQVLVYSYDTAAARTGITRLLTDLADTGLVLNDVQTRQSSLEEIFVDLLRENAEA
ncbi:multidrug ABC transporter ATP-binding protein [Maritimibacter sp. 55A14]|uniref:ABC transporter ATP-binding protein n=1 Tax=Maritimibacter sp. 55A14 TaxID=2174844 RepID=UPI000D610630|nr:ABC transporter ATP-binding protein [Maritimibacter sp. 55A14]PWE33761.1 multidrug ABC transporter ATP-binding protein [Maritimibacter sp. 55A14]